MNGVVGLSHQQCYQKQVSEIPKQEKQLDTQDGPKGGKDERLLLGKTVGKTGERRF